MGRTVAGGSVIQSVASTASGTASTTSPSVGGKEGYPCFMMLGGNGNTYWSAKVYNSEFCVISEPWGDAMDTTVAYKYGLRNDGMYGYQADAGTLGAQFSTQLSSSYEHYTQSVHNTDQYPFSQSINCTPKGYWKGNSIYAGFSKRFYNSHLINAVMTEGRRPRRFFCNEGRYFYEAQSIDNLSRTHKKFEFDMQSISDVTLASASFGNACYNMRTKRLAYVNKLSSYNAHFIIMESTKCLFDDGPEAFFENMTVTNQFSNTSNITQFRNADSDACAILLGDNNLIGLHYRYSNSAYYYVIDTSGNQVVSDEAGGTTSYGNNQGREYCNKMQSTWDHEWALMYSAYHYYGNGLIGHSASTRDPSKYFEHIFGNSSGGGFAYPLGRSGFFFAIGDNHDNKGLTVRSWDFGVSKGYLDQANIPVSIGTTAGVQEIANGSAITPTAYQTGMTGWSQTTHYPRYTGCSYWPEINSSMTYPGEI